MTLPTALAMLIPVTREGSLAHGLAFFSASIAGGIDLSVGQAVSSCGKEGRLEVQGEKLLQELISHEQALLAKLEAAKQAAQELLGQAEVEAQAIAAEIDKQIARLTAEQTAQTRRQAEEVRLASLAKVEAEVARLEARSQGRLDEAVKLVLERVLP